MTHTAEHICPEGFEGEDHHDEEHDHAHGDHAHGDHAHGQEDATLELESHTLVEIE
jgi:hypothetical protein